MAIPALDPTEQIATTLKFCVVHSGLALESPGSAAWLVTGACALAQQAAVLALKAAGDTIPAQTGASELLLRAASKDRLPPPYTLPLTAAARRDFDRLVECRNSFMHPRGLAWHVTPDTLARGLSVVVASVRHLLLIQPVRAELVASPQRVDIEAGLADLTALAEFLAD
ncbi:MAG: hypothetical protein QNI84_01535 [Henriciella sp.]|nr:hypothetical protein [Henriciella sp.]